MHTESAHHTQERRLWKLQSNMEGLRWWRWRQWRRFWITIEQTTPAAPPATHPQVKILQGMEVLGFQCEWWEVLGFSLNPFFAGCFAIQHVEERSSLLKKPVFDGDVDRKTVKETARWRQVGDTMACGDCDAAERDKMADSYTVSHINQAPSNWDLNWTNYSTLVWKMSNSMR